MKIISRIELLVFGHQGATTNFFQGRGIIARQQRSRG